jgi:hypothetical protein
MRLVNPDKTVSVLNEDWLVPEATPSQGVWATLELAISGVPCLSTMPHRTLRSVPVWPSTLSRSANQSSRSGPNSCHNPCTLYWPI